MGSWGSGPFQNDAALDHVGGICDVLMKPVHETLETQTLGSTYLRAVASLAILTEIARVSPVRPHARVGGREVDASTLRAELLASFDAKLDDEDDAAFRQEQRDALQATLDAFVGACSK